MRGAKILLLVLLAVTHSHQSPLDTEKETKNWQRFEPNTQIFADNEPTSYRLPNDTRPVRYDIWLKTDVDKADFAFDGRVKIHIQALEETSTVTVHYREITISKVDHVDASGNILTPALPFDFIQPYEFLHITLPKVMSVNEDFILEITYNGILRTANAGFYRASYIDYSTPANETVYYAVTQFESTDARHAFPCYDEPGIRAPIGLRIQHASRYSAYANMPEIDTIPVPETDHVTSVFADTPSMQTYLLAFLVSPFEYVENGDAVFPQRILAKPASIERGEADYANAIVDPILKKFIELLGVNFTLPKLDHAAITQFAAGAMENWGFITYRESALLLSTSYTEAQVAFYRMYIAEVIAHEIAHQWTGNLVSPVWWTHLWLNEGFATLYEYYVPHLLWPNDGYEEDFRVSALGSALRNDLPTVASAVPMSHYVETPRDISNRFNFISYAKSGSVLKMFQETLSVGTFTKGVGRYLARMNNQAAVPEDLFASLQEACDEDLPGHGLNIASAMGSWVYQAGYPLVSVERLGQTLVLRQRRYPSGGNIYSIPLSFATEKNPNFSRRTVRLWLTGETRTVSLSQVGMDADEWVIFNVQQTGYYRMAYDSGLWRAIARGLRTNHSAVDFVNRRVLQEELNIGFATLTLLQAAEVLEVQRYLGHEERYEVWNDAGTVLRSLNTTLFGTEVYPHFLQFVQSISRPHLTSIGFEATDGESADTRELRTRVKTFNCYALDDDCLAHEHQKLLFYTQNELMNPIPDFCSGFRKANATVYAHYLQQLADNVAQANRARIVASIGCSLDKNLLGLVITTVEDTQNVLTSNERVTIVRNMLTTSTVGFEVAFAYVSRNIESVSQYTSQLQTTVSTQAIADELEKILDDAVDGGFLTLTNAESTKSAVKARLVLQLRHVDGLAEWFESIEETTTTTQATTTTGSVSTTTSLPPTTTPSSAASVVASVLMIFVATFSVRVL